MFKTTLNSIIVNVNMVRNAIDMMNNNDNIT